MKDKPLAPCEKCGCKDVILKKFEEVYGDIGAIEGISFIPICTHCGDDDFHREIRFTKRVIENNQNNILIVREW